LLTSSEGKNVQNKSNGYLLKHCALTVENATNLWSRVFHK